MAAQPARSARPMANRVAVWPGNRHLASRMPREQQSEGNRVELCRSVGRNGRPDHQKRRRQARQAQREQMVASDEFSGEERTHDFGGSVRQLPDRPAMHVAGRTAD